MPKIVGDIVLAYNPYADRAHCIAVEKSAMTGRNALSFSVSKTIEQGKFIQDGDTINLEGNYDEIINYNYIQAWIKPAQNAPSSTILTLPAYFFITSYRYLNNDTTAVTIELDSVQTYYNYIDQLSGHLARSHAPRRIYQVVDGTDIEKVLISPDLYYAEDEMQDNYVLTEKTAIDTRSGDGDGYLLLVLNLPESMIKRTGLIEDDTTATSYIRSSNIIISCNPQATCRKNIATLASIEPWWTQSTYWGNSSFHEGAVNGVTDNIALSAMGEAAVSLLGYRTYLAFQPITRYDNSSLHVMDGSQLSLHSVGQTQLIAVLIPNFDNEYELSLGVPQVGCDELQGTTLSMHGKWGLDSLLWFGPLLADKIVSATIIPSIEVTNITSGGGWTSGYARMGVCAVTCQNDGTEWSTDQSSDYEYMGQPTTSTREIFLCTDMSQLSFLLPHPYADAGDNHADFACSEVAYQMGLAHSNLPSTNIEGDRSIERELKLRLYPYRFSSIKFWGTNVIYKYQEVAPIVWCNSSWDTESNQLWSALFDTFYCIDPLASQPTIYSGYLAQPTMLHPHDISNGMISLEDSISSLVSALTDAGIVGEEETSIVPAISSLLKDTLDMTAVDAENASYMTSFAVYQDSYQEYMNYSKALSIVENEYAYKQAQIQKSQSITGGVLGSLFGVAGIGLGGAQVNAGKGETLGWLGGSTLLSGSQSISSGIQSAGYSGWTFDNQTAYIYNKQSALETSTAGKPPSQTGGSNGNNAMAFSAQSDGKILVESYSYPINVLNQLEQRFYRWGYSIPEDVVLEGDTALSELPWLKSQFFYIQFDNVQSISFTFKEGYTNDDEGVRHDYFHAVPMIYQQDICDRLCKGITFVRADGNDGDVSTLKIDYSKDNYDTQTLDHPLYNRWWQN